MFSICVYENNELIQDHVCGWKIDNQSNRCSRRSKQENGLFYAVPWSKVTISNKSMSLCIYARPLNCFFSTYLCDSETKIDIELKVSVTFSVNYYNLCHVLVSFLFSTGRSIFSHDTFALRIKDGGKFK